ncbi:MAG: acyltransferase [Reinekea sp.]|nr:acyltransferase [Reinekea sp.]
MRKLFSAFMGVISVLTLIVYTLFLGIFLFLAILLRFLLPTTLARTYANPLIVEVALIWVGGILWWLRRIHRVQLDMAHDLTLDMQQWNLIIANHQSWLDIFVLFFVTYRKLPVLKFFIKSQLIWVPVAGAAWWALDYPFMSRYSKSYLEKHPEKAGKDLETTKRACEKFSEQPTSVVNFLEGTRFTKAKHQQQQSPYRHLLKPKAGGVAFALQALGEKFSTVIDATLHYEGGAPSTWDVACGRIGKVTIRLQKRHIPDAFLTMDYTNNADDKAAFQAWITQLWQEKDSLLESLDNTR